MAQQGTSARRAVITGASAGIGAALATALAARGHDLLLVARRLERLEELHRSLTAKYKVSVDVLRADLTKSVDLDRVEAAIEADDRLGLVVNNAGFAGYRPFKDLDPEMADDLIDLHVRAVTRLSRAAVPGMHTASPASNPCSVALTTSSALIEPGSGPPRPATV